MRMTQVLGGTSSQRCGLVQPVVTGATPSSANRRSQVLRTQQHSFAGTSTSASSSSTGEREMRKHKMRPRRLKTIVVVVALSLNCLEHPDAACIAMSNVGLDDRI